MLVDKNATYLCSKSISTLMQQAIQDSVISISGSTSYAHSIWTTLSWPLKLKKNWWHSSVISTRSSQKCAPYSQRNGLVQTIAFWIKGQKKSTLTLPASYLHPLLARTSVPLLTVLFDFQLLPYMHCSCHFMGQKWNRVINLSWNDITLLFTYSSYKRLHNFNSFWSLNSN